MENGPFIDNLAITLGIFPSKLSNYQRVKKQFERTSQTLPIPTILQFKKSWRSDKSTKLTQRSSLIFPALKKPPRLLLGISQQPRKNHTERVKIFRYRQVKDQILPRMLQLLGSAAPKVKVQAAG